MEIKRRKIPTLAGHIGYLWEIPKTGSNYQQYSRYTIEDFDKPIVILYFGDYEPFKNSGSRAKGLTIPKSAFKDIQQWFIMLQVQRKGWDNARKLVMERDRENTNGRHFQMSRRED